MFFFKKVCSIKFKILLLIIVSSSILTALVNILIVSLSFNYLNNYQDNQIDHISQDLIIKSIYPLLMDNQLLLNQIIKKVTTENKNIIDIKIFKANKKLDINFKKKIIVKDDFFKKIIQPINISQYQPSYILLQKNKQIISKYIGYLELTYSTQEIRNKKIKLLCYIFFFSIIGLVFTSFFINLILIKIFAPFAQLSQAMNDVKNGQIDVKLPPSPIQEANMLIEGFNQMSYQLAQNETHLKNEINKAVAETQKSINTLKKRNMTLDLARQSAVKANKSKSEFLAKISHEIRTPMNGINGFIELLQETNLDLAQQEHVNVIEQSTKNLLNIINNILELSKLNSAQIKLNNKPIHLRQTFENLIFFHAPKAHQKRLELILLINEHLPEYIVADKTKLHQIFDNLLDNAIKFTPIDNITLQILPYKEQNKAGYINIEFNVIDSGIGISENQQKIIFNDFEQIENFHKTAHSGIGLGLSICKKLTMLMQGKIKIESHIGEGTTFKVILSFKIADKKFSIKSINKSNQNILLLDNHNLSRLAISGILQESYHNIHASPYNRYLRTFKNQSKAVDILILSFSATELQHKTIKNIIDQALNIPHKKVIACISGSIKTYQPLFNKDYFYRVLSKPLKQDNFLNLLHSIFITPVASSAKHLKSKDEERKWLSGLNLLIADDNLENRLLLKSLLSKYGCHITLAKDGLETYEKIISSHFDLILLDIYMPKLSGIEVFNKLNLEYPEKINIPMIVLTADTTLMLEEEMQKAGINCLLRKPYKLAHLLLLIASKLHIQPIEMPRLSNDIFSQKALDYDGIDYKKALEVTGGDKDVFQQILAEFMNELPNHLQRIGRDYHQKNWQKLRTSCHKLKSAAGICGATGLISHVVKIEQAIDNNDKSSIDIGFKLLIADAETLCKNIIH